MVTNRSQDGAHDLPSDSVDVLVSSWEALQPDLDLSPLAVLQRIARLSHHINTDLEDFFATYGLSSASFYVLTTLARLGEEGRVSQTRLMDELGLSSGTVSVRIGRLVEQGLVDCQVDPDSKRNTVITLTAHGRELCERVAPVHLANERRLLSALSEDEEQALVFLLRKLLVEFEGSELPSGTPALLGLTLAPAHVTISMRESVGLPSVPALLVRAVAEGGTANAAGIRAGDVLVRSRGRDLRSISDLYAAIDGAQRTHRLAITVLRGTDPHEVIIQLGGNGSTEARPASAAGRTARGEHRL